MFKFETRNEMMNFNGKKITISNPISRCEMTSKSPTQRIRNHVISRIIQVQKDYLDVLTFHVKVSLEIFTAKLLFYLHLQSIELLYNIF